MMRVLATVASIFMLLAVPAAGQEGNPAFMTPDTGPKQPNNTDRVFGHAAALGGMAEVAVAPAFMTFRLPEALDFAQGAALILNYHTAYFALKLRGRLAEGERVLVHGAAGGVGTATLQVAKGLGASTVAVV
ncbi:MAG: hypothetical protein ACREVB_12610, partial [Burkholderiales bacterium]